MNPRAPIRIVEFNRLPRALREEIARLTATSAPPCIATAADHGVWIGYVAASILAVALVETRAFGTLLSIGHATNWVPLWVGAAVALVARFAFSVPYQPGLYVYPAWIMHARWDGRVAFYDVDAPMITSMQSGKRLQHYEGERARFTAGERRAELSVYPGMVGGDRTIRSRPAVQARLAELLRPISVYRDARRDNNATAMSALDPLAAWSQLPQWEGAGAEATAPRARPAPPWLLRALRPMAAFAMVWPLLVLVASLLQPAARPASPAARPQAMGVAPVPSAAPPARAQNAPEVERWLRAVWTSFGAPGRSPVAVYVSPIEVLGAPPAQPSRRRRRHRDNDEDPGLSEARRGDWVHSTGSIVADTVASQLEFIARREGVAAPTPASARVTSEPTAAAPSVRVDAAVVVEPRTVINLATRRELPILRWRVTITFVAPDGLRVVRSAETGTNASGDRGVGYTTPALDAAFQSGAYAAQGELRRLIFEALN